MSEDVDDQARSLLGRTVDYRGRTCRVVELLDDPPALILQDEASGTTDMQANQHGEAHRRVPRTYNVALYHINAAGERETHPDFSALKPAE